MAENNLGVYHISSDLSKYEVARSNFFTLIVDDIDGLVKSDFDLDVPSKEDKLYGCQEALKLSVTKFKPPHFTTEPITIRRGNSIIKYAGSPNVDVGEIVVQDFVGLKTKSILMAWQNLAYNVVTDKGGRAVNYKKNCTLVEYTQDWKKIRHWDLIGCWISGISESEFDITGTGDARAVTVTLQYDRAIMHDDFED